MVKSGFVTTNPFPSPQAARSTPPPAVTPKLCGAQSPFDVTEADCPADPSVGQAAASPAEKT